MPSHNVLMRWAATVVAALGILGAAACDFLRPASPRLPYLTASMGQGGCGYEWNDAAMFLEGAERKAASWDGGKDVAFLFSLQPVPESCVRQAHDALRRAGFDRVWIVPIPAQEASRRPLIPS